MCGGGTAKRYIYVYHQIGKTQLEFGKLDSNLISFRTVSCSNHLTSRNVYGMRNSECVRHVIKDRYQIMDRGMATSKLRRGKFSREVHVPPLSHSHTHTNAHTLSLSLSLFFCRPFERKCANSVRK